MRYEDLPEEKLLRLAADGDLQAVAELYRRYRDKLEGLVIKMGLSADDANDAVQNVFATFIIKLADGIVIRNFGAWITRCVKNRAIDVIRGLKTASENRRTDDPVDPSSEIECVDPGPTPGDILDLKRLVDLLRSSIREFEEEPLRDMAEFILEWTETNGSPPSVREIAEGMGIPASTVQDRRRRIFEKWRAILETHGYGDWIHE